MKEPLEFDNREDIKQNVYEGFPHLDKEWETLDDIISKKWIGYVSIKLDLEFVLESLEAIENYPEAPEVWVRGVWYSSVFTYAKCFTEAKTGRGVQLNESNLRKERPELVEYHKFLMHKRHNFLAHSGDCEFEYFETRLVKFEDEERLVYAGTKAVTPKQKKLEGFKLLLQYQIDYVQKKKEQLKKKNLSARKL